VTLSIEKTVWADGQMDRWTDEEFMALPNDGHRYELVNGKLLDIGNSGIEHGYVACILVALLTTFVQQNKLGAVCDSSTAFTLKNGNKHSPDVSIFGIRF
jgi:Uma2 family endonuclease